MDAKKTCSVCLQIETRPTRIQSLGVCPKCPGQSHFICRTCRRVLSHKIISNCADCGSGYSIAEIECGDVYLVHNKNKVTAYFGIDEIACPKCLQCMYCNCYGIAVYKKCIYCSIIVVQLRCNECGQMRWFYRTGCWMAKSKKICSEHCEIGGSATKAAAAATIKFVTTDDNPNS